MVKVSTIVDRLANLGKREGNPTHEPVPFARLQSDSPNCQPAPGYTRHSPVATNRSFVPLIARRPSILIRFVPREREHLGQCIQRCLTRRSGLFKYSIDPTSKLPCHCFVPEIFYPPKSQQWETPPPLSPWRFQIRLFSI